MITHVTETDPFEDRVRQVITGNPHLPRRTLRIETHEGCVTLRGVVRSFYQKQMAQESLKAVEGLRQIENLLQVVW